METEEAEAIIAQSDSNRLLLVKVCCMAAAHDASGSALGVAKAKAAARGIGNRWVMAKALEMIANISQDPVDIEAARVAFLDPNLGVAEKEARLEYLAEYSLITQLLPVQ